MGEFGLIERVRRWLGPGSVPLGIGDDAAVLDVGGGVSLAACVDTLVEGDHFRLDWSSPSDVGFKAVAVNVSDLAATGSEPRWLLVSLGTPPSIEEDALRGLYGGLAEGCGAFGAELVGGDTVRSSELVVTVCALGSLDGAPLTRSGARPGDVLAVTGPLGRAAAGVNLLLSQNPRGLDPDAALACMDAHRRPRPRLREGLALRRAGARACIDLSDGLLSDVERLCEASGVGVELDADRIPIADEVRSVASSRGWDAERIALAGGEDFELLVVVPEGFEAPGVELMPVGRVVDEGRWMLRAGTREPVPEGGWDHFGPPG